MSEHENDDRGDTGSAQPDEVLDAIRSRRSISRFTSASVEREFLKEAIELARWAPNHYLTEPWFFYILGDQAVAATIDCVYQLALESKGEEMAERKARRARKIPAWVVVTSKTSEDPVTNREDYAATCCAIHNFSLALWQRGIGMKWCTGPIVEDRRYYERLGIASDEERIVGILRIGYPAVVPNQRRKDVEDIAVELD